MADFLEMPGGHVGPHPTENLDFRELFEYLHSPLWVSYVCRKSVICDSKRQPQGLSLQIFGD